MKGRQDGAGCDNFIPDLCQEVERLEQGEFVLNLGGLMAHESDEVSLGVADDEQHIVPVHGPVLAQADGATPVAALPRVLARQVQFVGVSCASEPLVVRCWRGLALDAKVNDVAITIQLLDPVYGCLIV